jgi:hypothetical protein
MLVVFLLLEVLHEIRVLRVAFAKMNQGLRELLMIERIIVAFFTEDLELSPLSPLMQVESIVRLHLQTGPFRGLGFAGLDFKDSHIGG